MAHTSSSRGSDCLKQTRQRGKKISSRVLRLRKCRPAGALRSVPYALYYHNTALTGLVPNLNLKHFFINNLFIAGKMIFRDQASERRYFGSRNIVFGMPKPCKGDILLVDSAEFPE